MPRIDSNVCVLDVEKGRVQLARRVNNGEKRIPVTIRGYITDIWGNDDGCSIPFTVEVADVYERKR